MKNGTAKITTVYNNKKYVCKVVVKDALKNHMSYKLIDVPENKDLMGHSCRAIKIINNNDTAVTVNVSCKHYDKDGFYINDNGRTYAIDKNNYIIDLVQYDEYTKIELKNIHQSNPIDIEYSISDPYIENNYECRDIAFSNASKRQKTVYYSVAYYNSNNELVIVHNCMHSGMVSLPAGEKVKVSEKNELELTEKYDIQKIEVFAY